MLPLKNLPAILPTLSSQKFSLGETPWLTGYHATPEVTLFFYYHHVTYRTPCYASGHLVIFTVSATDLRERILLSTVFYLTLLPASFKASLGPSRVSFWYFWNIAPANYLFESQQSTKSLILVSLFKPYGWLDHVNNLLLTGFKPFSRQVKHVKSLMLYPFSHRATRPTTNFLIFIPVKLAAKILATTYDFAVNIVMVRNITIATNKTHNIHDSIYAASTYDFAVNIVMVIAM